MGSGPKWHTNYTLTQPFIVYDVGNFSAFEIKVQAVNAKGEGPEPDPVIGYSGEDGEICWFPFTGNISVLVDILSQPSPLSVVCLSSAGGSYRCGYIDTEQHRHQGDLGTGGQKDSQRTPAGIQGTEPVSLLLFGEHVAPLSS